MSRKQAANTSWAGKSERWELWENARRISRYLKFLAPYLATGAYRYGFAHSHDGTHG